MTEKARLRNAPHNGRYSSRAAIPLPLRPLRQQPLKPVALRVDSLQKRYGELDAVAGVSFDVREGEVFGLLGPNGAGKTTMIAMLATERAPTGGDATLFDHSIRNEPRIVRQMIGVAPQDIAIYPMLTAAENLRFFGRIYGVIRVDSKADRRAAEARRFGKPPQRLRRRVLRRDEAAAQSRGGSGA